MLLCSALTTSAEWLNVVFCSVIQKVVAIQWALLSKMRIPVKGKWLELYKRSNFSSVSYKRSSGYVKLMKKRWLDQGQLKVFHFLEWCHCRIGLDPCSTFKMWRQNDRGPLVQGRTRILCHIQLILFFFKFHAYLKGWIALEWLRNTCWMLAQLPGRCWCSSWK